MNLYPVLLMKKLRCRDVKQLDQGLTVIHKVRIEPEQFEQLQGLNSVALLLISTQPLALLQKREIRANHF